MAAKTERNNKIIALRKKGWTLQRIGDKYGLTRQRVNQIINYFG